MKSATTASTAIPRPSMRMPVWPVAANDVADPAAAKRVEDLQLRRHLADVAVGADGEDDGRVDVAHAAARHLEPRGRTAEVVDRDAMLRGERRELRDVGDEGVQPAPDLEPLLDRAREKQDPLGGQLAPRGRDADRAARSAFSASPSSSVATTGMSPPKPMTSCARRPGGVASITPTTRSGV